MKLDNARRFTSVHQSLTFTRRMAIAAGAQMLGGVAFVAFHGSWNRARVSGAIPSWSRLP